MAKFVSMESDVINVEQIVRITGPMKFDQLFTVNIHFVNEHKGFNFRSEEDARNFIQSLVNA